MLMFIAAGFADQMAYASLNTSHVNVYLQSLQHLRSLQAGFNTSHVNVYRLQRHNAAYGYIVSIHPMLMFISV